MSGVSRETEARLHAYADLLAKWTKRINLIAPSTVPQIWSRHIEDSMQLYHLAPPDWRMWVDMGSGGGLPGVVIAILAAERRDSEVILVESDARKCAFLRTALRETGAPTRVLQSRVEGLDPMGADVVSARALAPLPELLNYADRHLSKQGAAIFPKGRNAQSEINEALEHWSFACEKHASQTDPAGVILRIGDLKRA